jgi:hypothetical protein
VGVGRSFALSVGGDVGRRLLGGALHNGGVADVGGAIGLAGAHVFFGADAQVGLLALLVEGVEVLEEGDAPHAAGAGAEAFTDEAGDGGVFARHEVANLAETHVETEADFVVGLHGAT